MKTFFFWSSLKFGVEISSSFHENLFFWGSLQSNCPPPQKKNFVLATCLHANLTTARKIESSKSKLASFDCPLPAPENLLISPATANLGLLKNVFFKSDHALRTSVTNTCFQTLISKPRLFAKVYINVVKPNAFMTLLNCLKLANCRMNFFFCFHIILQLFSWLMLRECLKIMHSKSLSFTLF